MLDEGRCEENCKTTLRLQVILRPTTALEAENSKNNNTNNHFVRFTPLTAQLLRDIALSNDHNNKLKTQSQIRRRWYIRDHHHQQEDNTLESRIPVTTKCESGIEFLPLAITLEGTGGGQVVIYASYNGGSISNHKNTNRTMHSTNQPPQQCYENIRSEERRVGKECRP